MEKRYKNIKAVNSKVCDKRGPISENGKPVFTKNLLVSFTETSKGFKLEPVLTASRLAQWCEVKTSLQVVPNVDYVLVEDSDVEFDATDTKPQAISATYRPMAICVE